MIFFILSGHFFCSYKLTFYSWSSRSWWNVIFGYFWSSNNVKPCPSVVLKHLWVSICCKTESSLLLESELEVAFMECWLVYMVLKLTELDVPPTPMHRTETDVPVLSLNSVPAVSESRFSAVTLGKMASAARMPLFIAVCVPLIFGTFMNPGLQPISSPPGNVSFGMDWRRKRENSSLQSFEHFRLFRCFTVSGVWHELVRDSDGTNVSKNTSITVLIQKQQKRF